MTSTQYPSGSKAKARPFMFPSLGFFLNSTPFCSSASQKESKSSTRKPMWPKPLFGSSLPLWCLNPSWDSVP